MQIGIVAKKIGLSVDAIRFYERNALLPRPPRTRGGFRQYAESDVETLAFIRRVQGLGFKLSEIRALLRLRGNRLQPCAPVRRRLEEKLVDVVVGPDAYRDLPNLIDQVDSGQKAVNVLLSRDETYADISPVRLNQDQAHEEAARGGWVPPCYMRITDERILNALTDISE